MVVVGGLARAVARPIISALVKKEMGPKAIVTSLRRLGFGYRYQNMLNDIREFTHFHKQWGWTTRISSLTPPPLETIPSIAFRQPYKFRGYLDVTKRNKYTGVESKETISFHSDSLLSPDQWVSDTLEAEAEDPTDPTVSITSARLVDVVKNEALF